MTQKVSPPFFLGTLFDDHALVPNDPSHGIFFRPIKQAIIIITLAFFVLALVAAIYTVRLTLIAALIGIAFGVIISPPVAYLRKKLRLPRSIGAFFSILLILGIATGAVYILIAITSDQFSALIAKLPEYSKNAKDYVYGFLDQYPKLKNAFERLPISEVARNTVKTLFIGVQTGATVIAGFFFVITIALYYATNPQDYLEGLLSVFPARSRLKGRMIIYQISTTLKQWFFAQLIAMSLVGIATSIGLLIIGVDYWLVLGLMFTVLDIVPYLGPLMAGIAATAITIATDPSKTLWVLALIIIIQQVEGDFVIPLVMKGRIRLPPIQLITLMLIFVQWFGIIGVLIAPPLLAIMRTLYLSIYVEKMNSLQSDKGSTQDNKKSTAA